MLAQVATAHGIYDFVDKRIQELDSQLVEFDKELAAERDRLGVEAVRLAALLPCFCAAGARAVPCCDGAVTHTAWRRPGLQSNGASLQEPAAIWPMDRPSTVLLLIGEAACAATECIMPQPVRAGTSRTPSTRRAATRSSRAAAEGGAAAEAEAPGAAP